MNLYIYTHANRTQAQRTANLVTRSERRARLRDGPAVASSSSESAKGKQWEKGLEVHPKLG